MLPDTAAVLVLEFAPCPGPLGLLARSSRVFAAAMRSAKESIQERVSRDVDRTERCCELHVHLRYKQFPNGMRHGLESSTCVPRKVGGPGSPCFYAERLWREGQLLQDAVWETNNWKRRFGSLYGQLHELCGSNEYDENPPAPLQLDHPLLQAMPLLGKFGVPCLERHWAEDGALHEVRLFEDDPEELEELRARTDWDMRSTESLFMAVDQLMY
mmetsp:Transcript_42059/g.78141  ORF Transcript_42059/g.78141 Transcript_42059/m.78141 type:complete len:214 (+) Transcript_42059:82-723(+)